MELAEFFKNSYTSSGVFYPTGYSIISFRSYAVAELAAGILLADGMKPEDVRFVSAKELLDLLEDVESTVTGMVMTTISRLTHTEAAKNDSDAERAKLGAGFVAVHCQAEANAIHVLDLVRGLRPMAMDLYKAGGVESLVSPALSATAQV